MSSIWRHRSLNFRTSKSVFSRQTGFLSASIRLLINRCSFILKTAVTSARLLGLGLKLYPSNMQRLLNKDLTRFMQSLCRVHQGCAGADWIHVGSLLLYLLCAYRVAYSEKAQTQTRLTSNVFEAVFSPQLSCYENPTAFLHYARIWNCRIKGAMSRG